MNEINIISFNAHHSETNMETFNSFLQEKLSKAIPQFNKDWTKLNLDLSKLWVVFEFECYMNLGFKECGDIFKHEFPEYGISLCERIKRKRKDPKKITIEQDISLEVTHMPKNHIGFELVSPWISGDKAEEVLIKFKRVFDKYKAITNDATGGHINIRFKENVDLDWVKIFLLSHEMSDLVKFERAKNPYTKSVMRVLRTCLSDTDLDDDALIISNVAKAFKTDKDHSINLLKMFNDYEGHEFGFVEFRGPGNDYLGSKFDLFKKTLKKYMNLMLVAGSNHFEAEYKTRLIRLRNMTKKSNTSADSRRSRPQH